MFLCFIQYEFSVKSNGKLINIRMMNKETCDDQYLRKINFSEIGDGA